MINWIGFQPLIGGMILGAEKAFNCLPKFILSYNGIKNEQHLINYNKYKNVPYILFEDHENFLNTLHEEQFNLLNKDIDVVSAVPICSGLSAQNSSNTGYKARGESAIQNENMYNISEFSLNIIKPKVLIFENAPGLYTNIGKKIREKLYLIAKKYNYSISFVYTSTILHGLPQNRCRTFCIMWKSKTSPIMNYYKDSYKSLIDLLSSIPINSSLQENIFEKEFNNFWMNYLHFKFSNYRDEMINTNSRTAFELMIKKNHFNLIKDYTTEKEYKLVERMKLKIESNKHVWDNSPFFLSYDKINALVGKNMCNTIHPIYERYFNAREMMTLMGMPFDFELQNPKININHIAQNVPVNTSYSWHLEILKFLENKLELSNSDYVMQNNIKQKIDLIHNTIFDIL